MSEDIRYSPASLDRSYGAPDIVNQRRVTLESLALQPGESVLDIGCGSGLLTEAIATAVGPEGRVIAMDRSDEMVAAATSRCATFAQVVVSSGDVCELGLPDESVDAVTCTQVLLYVADVPRALAEMTRVLKPGGRVAVLETDWRGVVMNASDPSLTTRIFRAWDDTVSSPNLPVKLGPLMRTAGLDTPRVIPIPLLNDTYDEAFFSVSALGWMSGNAVKRGAISRAEEEEWLADMASLGAEGSYFFCVNRFLFVAGRSLQVGT